MIPHRHLTNEKHDATLVTFTRQCEDYERCESMELDHEIRDLIERNAATGEATPSHRSCHSPKTSGKTASMSSQGTSEMSTAEAHAENAECAQSRRKNLTDSLEQKIRCLEKQRKELLEVNQQWDQHFRSMKELYERKVVDLKTKLAATEVRRTLEKERMRSLMEGDRQQTTQEEKERESLNEELQELKKENKLLKERNALTNKKKEHYECEIKRLNKALQDALKIESSSFSEDSRRCQGACNAAEMRTELEVLKQQPDSQWHALKQLPLCGQPKAHGFSSEKKANQ
uniref:TNFAIP3 interacting protein 3 n=1 Tax=Nannospalax galili TaxID=1026970 RepID=A0A8C6W6D7_NANGA